VPKFSDEDHDREISPGEWAVTLILCVLFSVAGAFWLKWATFPELGSQLTEAIPPVPAVATLLFLVGAGAVLRRFGVPLGLSRRQIITIYAFVSISVSIGFVNFYRDALVTLTGPNYGTTPSLREIKDYVPPWLGPTDEAVVRQFWEGSPTQSVPWKEWLVPMLSLGGILLVFYTVTLCMLRLFLKRWLREERLIYPVAQLALNMVEGEKVRGRAAPSAFSSKVFWVGVITVFLFNLLYIIPALSRTAPLPPYQLNMSDYLVDPPWNAIGIWVIRFNPIVFGLGFLVSLDVLLSIWLCFLLLKFQAVFLAGWGVPANSLFLIEAQQGMGAYAAMALFMIWAARRSILKAFRNVFPGADQSDPLQAGRWTVLVMVGGIAALLAVMCFAGMPLWLAGVFLAMILVRSLVIARIRAQAGIPMIYLMVGDSRQLIWLMGGALLATAGIRGASAMVFFGFLLWATLLVPHHADALALAERSGLGVRRWVIVAVLGVIVGLVLVNLTHLPAFYEYGSANIEAMGVRRADWNARKVIEPYLVSQPPERIKWAMAGTGFLTTCVLALMRRFYWFPLHPIGFVGACAAGAYGFGPILLIWFIKWAILRYFGGEVYRKAKNYFLGIVMGHLLVASIWGILAALRWYPTERYQLGFW